MDTTISVFLFLAIVDIVQNYNTSKNNRGSAVEGEAVEKPQLRYSIIRFGKRRGTFSATGFQYLSREVYDYIWKELKTGDELKLVPDPENDFENKAIKILCNKRHIGWFRGDLRAKSELYTALLNGRPVKARCTSNVRGPEYKRTAGEVKYQGLRQFVTGHYEYWNV